MRVAPIVNAALMVLIAWVAHSWVALIALLVPSGIVSATISSATNQFLARRIRGGRQGVSFGVKQAAVPLASLLGGLAVPAVALTVGWRWAFVFAAVLAAGALMIVPAPPTTLAARTTQRRSAPAPRVAVGPLAVFAAGLGLGVFAASGLAAFLVTAAVSIGIGQGTAGVAVAVASAAAVVMRVAVGHLADVRARQHFRVIAAMLVVGVLGYVCACVGSATHSAWPFVLGTLMALGVGWGWNGLFNFAVVLTHMHAPARATSITQVGGRLGGVAGPFVIGFVADRASFAAAWAVAGCVVLLAAVAMVAGKRLLDGRQGLGAVPAGPDGG
jgi:MFS family permease